MANNPHLTAIEHVASILKGDSAFVASVTGGIHEGSVPKGKPAKEQKYPIVLIQTFGEGQDVAGLASRPATIVTLQILVIDEVKNMAGLAGIAERLDELLEGSGPGATAHEGYVASCRRTQAIYRTENEEGRLFRYLGGRYRFLTN
jgi:hypothetical protein